VQQQQQQQEEEQGQEQGQHAPAVVAAAAAQQSGGGGEGDDAGMELDLSSLDDNVASVGSNASAAVETDALRIGFGADEPLEVGEPKYCRCHKPSLGAMVRCDNERCPIEWWVKQASLYLFVVDRYCMTEYSTNFMRYFTLIFILVGFTSRASASLSARVEGGGVLTATVRGWTRMHGK
jgi:hypothetical protein